jgi:N-acyl homoserine lactone hydrolase
MKKPIALVLALVSLIAIAVVLVPYRPNRIVGRSYADVPVALPPSVPGVRLHVFNTGMNRMSPLLVPDSDPPWRPAPAFVIEHPREGLIVFDCGLSEAVAERGEAALPAPMRWFFKSRSKPGRTLDAQMREAGLDPSKVRTVILSHLHEDHTGVASAFPQATFIGGEGTSKVVFGDFAPKWREVTRAEAKGKLAPFDGALDFFGDGSVLLVPGGGHRREDLMAFVALSGGPALLAGDAVPHRPWLASDDVERVPVDPKRAADVRNQVRALLKAEPTVVLFSGHDLSGTPSGREDMILHHPEWFGEADWPLSR